MIVAGKVVGRPMPVSSSPTESPNDQWGPSQMKLNGFMYCNMEHNPTIEKLDFDSWEIIEDEVHFSTIPLTADEINSKSNVENESKRKAEQPSLEEKVDALWDSFVHDNHDKLLDIQSKIANINLKYPVVDK